MNILLIVLIILIIILLLIHKKPIPKPDSSGCQPVIPDSTRGPDNKQYTNSNYYNPIYSGSSKSGLPLLNRYSKLVSDNTYGVYGFSLDDAVGLKSCGSWTFNTIIGPRCNNQDGRCKLPQSGKVVTNDSRFILVDVTSQETFIDQTDDWKDIKNKEAYFTSDQIKEYLTIYEIKSNDQCITVDNTGSIDTDFSEFPQNHYFINELSGNQNNVKKDSFFNFAFNVINQSGGPNSLITGKVPIWASIEIGSPPVVVVVKKIMPNQGFQFLLNLGSDPLSKTLVEQPTVPIKNKYISGYLQKVSASDGITGSPPYEGCAIECNSDYTLLKQVKCDDITGTETVSTGTVKCPSGNYIENGIIKGKWDPKVTQCNKGKQLPSGNYSYCNFLLNPLCEEYDGLVKPLCCDDSGIDQNLNTPDLSKCGLLSDPNYTQNFQSRHFDWQIGGGRIAISLVDPDTLDGVPNKIKDTMSITPLCTNQECIGQGFPPTNDWRAQRYVTGAKIGGGKPDYYASLLEFTIDLYTNINEPSKIIPTIFYDISGVNNLNRLPIYSKAVGINNSTGATCNQGDCCYTFVGNIDTPDVIKDCPTDIYFTKDSSGIVQDYWGKCPSPIDFCSGGYDDLVGDLSDTTIPTKNSPICNQWSDFGNELITPQTNPLDINRAIWGCDPDFINPEKCRSMHLGVFPNFTQLVDGSGSASDTSFTKPDKYLPWGFECGVPACVNSKGTKPYKKDGTSMDCGSSDPNCCGSSDVSGNYCWGNGSVRFSK